MSGHPQQYLVSDRSDNRLCVWPKSMEQVYAPCRLEGTVSKLEAQMGMLAMNKNIAALTKNLQQTLSNNELSKAAKVMEEFDKALVGLELQGMNMSSVMGQQVAQSTPQAQVNDLLTQIADEQGMQLQTDLPGAPSRLVAKEKEDDINEGIKKLRE
jgi:charged multivesicular body protein 1